MERDSWLSIGTATMHVVDVRTFSISTTFIYVVVIRIGISHRGLSIGRASIIISSMILRRIIMTMR